MKGAILAVAVLALGGCASDAIRPVARGTMGLSQGLETELMEFADRQNAEIQARRSNIAGLDENTSASALIAQEQVMDWRSAGNETALRIYEQASGLEVGTQLAGRETLALLAPEPQDQSVNLDPKNYDALVKALKPLADKRSAFKDVGFLFSYGQSVVDAMNANVAKTKAADGKPDQPAEVEKPK